MKFSCKTFLALTSFAGVAFVGSVEAQITADISGWGTGEVSAETVVSGRPWGWAMRDYMLDPDRELFNTAKASLLAGEQIFSHYVTSLNIERYCEEAPHYDYTWFEMQHSLMSYADVATMLAACPKVGASPIPRLPDASEGAVQKAMDMGMLGVVVPTVDDAIMAREAARYTRFPPLARRSLGGGQLFSIWGPEVKQGEDFLETMSDNMLVIVMIETVEGVNNALEIATVPGVDVVMIGNADLSNFSGYAQDSQDYHDLQIKVRNATYRAGKLYGNAAFANFEGNPLSSDSRLHLQGPANDGWDNPNVPGAY